MGSWKKTKIGEFLLERAGKYKPDSEKIAGLKRIDKIDFSGNFHIAQKSSRTNMILIHPGDLVVSGINVSKGAIGIYTGKDNVTATIHYSSYTFDREKINVEYFKRFLKSPEFIKLLQEQVKGGIKTEIKPKHILPLEIKLPVIEEQAKLVSHFKRIETEDIEMRQELTHQQTLLKKLRQQILQEAIEGKLTAQWRKENPDIEPASVLLEKIKAEKAQLVKEKKIKKQKSLPPVTEEEKPFELPDGWEWCRLGDICDVVTKGSSPKWQGINYVDSYEKGILFITSKNVGKYTIDLSNSTFVEKSFNEIEPRSILKKGDLLTNIVGASIGRTAIYNLDFNANINQAVCILRIEHNHISKQFLLKLMNADFIIQLMLDMQFSPGRANLSMSNLAKFSIALPPLPEQKAIVTKVEKLLALCDQLETRITRNQAHADQLMQAVLKEAFDPDGQEPGRKQPLQSKEV